MESKRREIAPPGKARFGARALAARRLGAEPVRFAAALRRADGRLAVIAEIKRRSPSAGEIAADASSVDQAAAYQAAGADALSVLTNAKYFGGSLEDLRAVAAQDGGDAPSPPLPQEGFYGSPDPGSRGPRVGSERDTDNREGPGRGRDSVPARRGPGRGTGRPLRGARRGGNRARPSARRGAHWRQQPRPCRLHNGPRPERAPDPKVPGGRHRRERERDLQTPRTGTRRRAGAHAVLVGEALMRSPNPAALVASLRSV